jgi:N-acyl-D-amino-acid deacylase
MSTVLIKNGLVYDGTGAAPKKTDVLIQRTLVARLGDFSRGEAERVIDATGAMVVPGFVEMDFEPEAEDEFISEVSQRYLLRRGVTTAVDGADGTSFAPVVKPLRRGSHDWQTVGEFRRSLKARHPAVNFGTLVGYAGLRQSFAGGKGRDLDFGEMRQISDIIKQALAEGALGVGLGDLGILRLPEWELVALAEEANRAERFLAVHLSGMTGELGEELDLVLSAAKKSGVSVEFTHFEPSAGKADSYRSALATMEKQAARANVNFDVFPMPYARFPLANFLPSWFRSGTPAEVLADVRSAHAKDRLLAHFKKLPLGGLRIAEVPRHLKFLKGKRIGELAASWGTRPERAFLKLMLTTRLECKIFDENMESTVLAELVASPHSILSLSFHESEAGNLKDIFASAAAGGKIAEEQVIAKLTGAPAKKLGLPRRGFIAPDHFADIVILRDYEVQSVFVNGAEVFADGVFAAERNGTVL